jgi:S1-C subfamily serine protease
MIKAMQGGLMNKVKLSLFIILSIGLSAQAQVNTKKESQMFLENEQNSISVFQNTANSIVNVSNIKKSRGFFDMDATEVQAGLGSGLVWDNLGHIITNFHVIDNGDAFSVAFKDDPKQYKAKFIGGDPKNDIAVLKLIELPKQLKPIPRGDSKSLLVGQKALAIGNPLGLDHSLSTGSISALGRKIKGYGGVSINGMIQTDASINPGNSGGALLDSQGRLIGINTMIYNAGGSQASAGLGFAIPVAIVKDIVPQIIQFGKVNRPGLGVGILEEGYAIRFGVNEGVMIKYVDPKSSAAKAGLRGIMEDRRGYYPGDVIIGINNDSIKNFDDLYSSVNKYKIGDKIKVKVIRDGKQKTFEITLVQV